MRIYGEVEALSECEWSTLRSGRVTPGKWATGDSFIGGCVDLRAGLDAEEKRTILPLPEIEN
jgi:hypothetical protein